MMTKVRDKDRQTDRQTSRQTDRQAGRQIGCGGVWRRDGLPCSTCTVESHVGFGAVLEPPPPSYGSQAFGLTALSVADCGMLHDLGLTPVFKRVCVLP